MNGVQLHQQLKNFYFDKFLTNKQPHFKALFLTSQYPNLFVFLLKTDYKSTRILTG